MQRVKTTETRSAKLKEYGKQLERLTRVLQLSKAFSRYRLIPPSMLNGRMVAGIMDPKLIDSGGRFHDGAFIRFMNPSNQPGTQSGHSRLVLDAKAIPSPSNPHIQLSPSVVNAAANIQTGLRVGGRVLLVVSIVASVIRIGKTIYDEIKIDDEIEEWQRAVSALEEDAGEGELSEEAKESLEFARILLADAEDCKRNPGKKTILCSLCVAGEWTGGAALGIPGVQAGALAGAVAGPIGCVAGGAVGGIAGALAGSALGSSAVQNFRADKDGIATEAQMTLVNMKDGAVLPVDGNVYIGKGIEVGARAGVLHIENERHHLDCVKVGANFGITSKGVDVGAEAKVVWREKENAVQRVGYGFNLDTGVQVDGQTRTFKVLGFGIEKSAEGIGLCTPVFNVFRKSSFFTRAPKAIN